MRFICRSLPMQHDIITVRQGMVPPQRVQGGPEHCFQAEICCGLTSASTAPEATVAYELGRTIANDGSWPPRDTAVLHEIPEVYPPDVHPNRASA
jgi:hypothetical protein